MITREQWALIHKLRKQGWGFRQLVRHLKIAQHTVRKALEQETYEQSAHHLQRIMGLNTFASQLPELAMKKGYNAQHVYTELLAQGYTVSYQQVRLAIQPLRKKALENWTKQAATIPGQQGHVYWGTTLILVGESRIRVNVFFMVLGHSGFFSGVFVLGERFNTFLACHESVFSFFGGVPSQLFYDNPKKVVAQYNIDGQVVEWNPALTNFLEPLGIEPRAAYQYDAHTREKVMTVLKPLKRTFLDGRQFADMNTLNVEFNQWRDQVVRNQDHGTKTLLERYHEEQPHLLPLAQHDSTKKYAQPEQPYSEDMRVKKDFV